MWLILELINRQSLTVNAKLTINRCHYYVQIVFNLKFAGTYLYVQIQATNPLNIAKRCEHRRHQIVIAYMFSDSKVLDQRSFIDVLNLIQDSIYSWQGRTQSHSSTFPYLSISAQSVFHILLGPISTQLLNRKVRKYIYIFLFIHWTVKLRQRFSAYN